MIGIATTSTTDLLCRASDLLSREYLTGTDARILRRTLRLIAGRTGHTVGDIIDALGQ